MNEPTETVRGGDEQCTKVINYDVSVADATTKTKRLWVIAGGKDVYNKEPDLRNMPTARRVWVCPSTHSIGSCRVYSRALDQL